MKTFNVYIIQNQGKSDPTRMSGLTAEEITALSIKENLVGVVFKQNWAGSSTENVPINEEFFDMYKNSPCVHLTKSKAKFENLKSYNT